MSFIYPEVRDFEHSKKTARFRVVVIEKAYNSVDESKSTTEELEEFHLELRQEKKGDFSLRHANDTSDWNFPLVSDSISGSVVLFFRLPSQQNFDTRMYINIVFNWLGKWKFIKFDNAVHYGTFRKKLK
ncbi:MAG: hypothetical protein IIA05_10900 [Proteobacteria bacterium]|nr:hypothetical protein [Pseudomonadota bacterium]